MISKLRCANKLEPVLSSLHSEEELGDKLWDLIEQAESAGFDAESALRRTSLRREKI